MKGYLDANRSVLISSPAGSGKTEKLARRYISLLEAGADVQRVLCITFTEKAAAEMKQRILDILNKENPPMLDDIWHKVPLMRIFTIHAFCLKLLKRFAMELGLDPALSVMEEHSAETLWNEAVYDCLMRERDKREGGGFFGMITERGLRGWGAVKRALKEMHCKSPYPEIFMRRGGKAEGECLKLLDAYAACLVRYKGMKAEKRVLDYNDLELLAYDALSSSPEWQNILYSFDEHTDHILVDEFQDTSSLQWMIIDKLTEEWRAGLGAKRETGGTPTIFLVGDEKQSIYMFRGANVGVFREAMEKFPRWLGGEYHFIEARENYRSLPAIVDFANTVFGSIMAGELGADDRGTRYASFEAVREGDGKVELLLYDALERVGETRAKEAAILAARINELVARSEISDAEGVRPCRFSDMAVLIRKRTHLSSLEEAFRGANIPFIVLKGVGFFEEPEIAVLREFISFIVDPKDDYSLFCLLRSPLFDVDYGTLHRLIGDGKQPLVEKLRLSGTDSLKRISRTIDGWVDGAVTPMSVLIERALLDTGGWAHYHESQRLANVKKFIAMVESLESEGRSPIEIREILLRQKHSRNVSKANINDECMDAVKIMTIHASKGLQFPIVFLPSMDESIIPKSSPVAINEDRGTITIDYEDDSGRRSKNEQFRRLRFKELEEEKRLFYVAVTRARDHLCMLGALKDCKVATGRLQYLEDAFGPLKEAGSYLRIMRGEDLPGNDKERGVGLVDTGGFMDEPSYTEPLEYAPPRPWKDVTGEIEIHARRQRHGDLIGRIMHKLFEELSKGAIKEDDIGQRAGRLLGTGSGDKEAILNYISQDMAGLKASGLLAEIVMPRKHSYTELPFVIERGNAIYKGRIDRVVLSGGKALLYDYKTFPASEAEIPDILEEYGFQMRIYKEAVEKLFRCGAEAYLLLTHLPLAVPFKAG